MNAIWKRVQREPVLVYNLVAVVIALAVSFGMNLTPTQIGAILAVTIAVLAVITRSQVTPVAAPRSRTGQPLVVPAANTTIGGHALADPTGHALTTPATTTNSAQPTVRVVPPKPGG